MEKHEILNLLLTKSDRIKILKDKKYEVDFPNQCHYIVVDGIKTKFYKCNLCIDTKGLITCGARNVKDSIRKHHEHSHGKFFSSGGGKRQADEIVPVGQKKLKTSNSRFQISHLDKNTRDVFGKKIAIWQASNDIPYNAIDEKFGEVLKSFAGISYKLYHMNHMI